MDQTLFLIFNLVVLIVSVMVHEVAHGLAANALGDPTAKDMGRLSFNPLKHLDFTGSFLVPLLLYISTHGGFVFGWAKPVPYNPYNLKNQKWGPGLVAAAGPLSNFSVALVLGLGLRFAPGLSGGVVLATVLVVYINLLLGVFNLMPVPPLDGSRILAAILPYRYELIFQRLERFGFFLVIIFIIFVFPLVSPILPRLFSLITGFSPGF